MGGGMLKLCGVDLATPQDEPSHGLPPGRARSGEARIKSVAVWISDTECQAVKTPSTEVLRKFLQKAADQKTTLVGWNLVFDLSWLHAIGLTKEVNACIWMDAMLLLKRVDGWKNRELGGKGYGLETQVAERWPEHADYGLGDTVTKVPSTDDEWRILLDYNLLDAKFACLLAREYLDNLSPEEQRAARQEAQGISPIALSAINGIHINVKALDALEADIAVRRAAAEAILGEDAEAVASPKKLADLLFNKWEFAVANTTPKGVPSTDKEALLTIELEHPHDARLGALMALRKVNVQQSKFVDSVRESIAYHGENVTRPSPIISGTATGRMPYGSNQGKGKAQIQTGVALHQWERGKATRSILEAPEGFLLAEFDASGQEARLMADASQDENMLKLFNEGGDIHAFTGAQIENVDYEWVRAEHSTNVDAKRVRNLGKFCALSSAYRIGIDTLPVRALTQYGLNLSVPEATQISETYKRTYKGVVRYWKDAVRTAASAGDDESKGRRRIVLENLNLYEQPQTAINFPIQSTGGDMKELAICVLRLEFNEDVMYAWDLHDALFLYIKDDSRTLETVKRIRNRLDTLFQILFTVSSVRE